MTNDYPVEIKQIFISPGHNYFGHAPDQPGTHPTHAVERVQACAGMGLVGDRFFGVRADFDGQITFFSWEVYQALIEQLDLNDATPAALRRNVVLAGVPLNALIGREFAIETMRAGQRETVWFLGAKHCSPCRWMDRGMGPGALQFLKGRGGLRAQILTDGCLYTGPARLRTEAELDLTTILSPISRPRLP